jgi:hypothetical protein
MIISSIFIIAVTLTTAGPAVAVGSSDGGKEKPEETQIYVGDDGESGFYRDDGYPIDTDLRPAINPDFAPDESCDPKWELKCIPGSEQGCFGDGLEGYNNGEMNVCTPIGCPDSYHDNFEWEDNICYSNEQGCHNDGYIMLDDEFGMTCEPPYLCEEPEHRDQDPCIEYCDENPWKEGCL